MAGRELKGSAESRTGSFCQDVVLVAHALASLSGSTFRHSNTAEGCSAERVTARRVACTPEWDRTGET
jgi:hypothetical protein